ncbi:MAG: S46 family peptidase, partial [Acidobacteriota bacterium]
RILGTLFDGNFEGLASDIAYDASQDRGIAADVRMIMHLMLLVYEANELIEELGF